MFPRRCCFDETDGRQPAHRPCSSLEVSAISSLEHKDLVKSQKSIRRKVLGRKRHTRGNQDTLHTAGEMPLQAGRGRQAGRRAPTAGWPLPPHAGSTVNKGSSQRPTQAGCPPRPPGPPRSQHPPHRCLPSPDTSNDYS